MGFDFTTTQLLASVKQRCMMAASSQTLSDTDILSLADGELQTYIMPLLIGTREEFAVASASVTVTAGVASYAIPSRAMGMELRQVLILSGNNATYMSLPRIEPERNPQLLYGGATFGYMFQDNYVVLLPTPASSGTLQLQYFRRPNKLVPTTSVATISSIDATRTIITTTASITSSITTGLLLDIVNNKSGFSTLAQDVTSTTTTSGSTVTVTSALPDNVVAGNYVCLAQESPVAQIPADLHPLLEERVAFKVLEAIGDPKAQVQKTVAEEMEKRVLKLLSPRSQGNARPVVSRFGAGGYNYWGRMRWWYR